MLSGSVHIGVLTNAQKYRRLRSNHYLKKNGERENYLIENTDCNKVKHITRQAITIKLRLSFVIVLVLS